MDEQASSTTAPASIFDVNMDDAKDVKPLVAHTVSTQGVEQRIALAPDFSALRVINPDIVGWIYQEGTEIDYPLIYSSERGYYLYRLYTRESNKHGSIYIDPDNNAEFTDRNTLIYGHNMKDETMFGSLYRYQEQAYFDVHPTMTLYTPEKTYLLELFAVTKINTSTSAPQTELATDLELSRYVSEVKNSSLVEYILLPENSDSIVTLVTCTTRDDMRLLVLGRLREL